MSRELSSQDDDNHRQLWTSTLSPHLLSPHFKLDFPIYSDLRHFPPHIIPEIGTAPLCLNYPSEGRGVSEKTNSNAGFYIHPPWKERA